MAATTASTASALLFRSGAQPPSSPPPVRRPRLRRMSRRAWKISAPMRSASRYVWAPTGTTMNSWMSTLLSACAPPLRMLNWGTGRSRAPSPPRWRYSGSRRAAAAARAAASDTPRRALAPRLEESRVPSVSRRRASTASCATGSRSRTAGARTLTTLSTARSTPLPRKRAASPSRSSRASREPVEAPDGTAARPKVPSSRWTSTSTVGLPRESRISRAFTSLMYAIRPASGEKSTPRRQQRSQRLRRARLGVAPHQRLGARGPEQDPGSVCEDHLAAVAGVQTRDAASGERGRHVLEPPRQALPRRGVDMIVDATAVERPDLLEQVAHLVPDRTTARRHHLGGEEPRQNTVLLGDVAAYAETGALLAYQEGAARRQVLAEVLEPDRRLVELSPVVGADGVEQVRGGDGPADSARHPSLREQIVGQDRQEQVGRDEHTAPIDDAEAV